MIILDCETYKNYFLVSMLDTDSGKIRDFELFDGQDFDSKTVSAILKKHTTLGFNSSNYDMPLIIAALSGHNNADIKQISDEIINGGSWVTRGEEGLITFFVETPKWEIHQRRKMIKEYYHFDHIDIMPLPIGQASLKIYGGRLHAPKMQELPIEPNATITPEQREILRHYCHNDLQVTRILYDELRPQIALREQMSKTYDVDLRSKSDAQIAECVIKHELELKDIPVNKPTTTQADFKYKVPDYITFTSPILKNVLATVQSVTFSIGDNGQVIMPDAIAKKIHYAGNDYQMGIGGLHSCENKRSIVTNESQRIFDVDVASFYPSIILDSKLYPRHLTPEFLNIYRAIVEKRIHAKHTGDKVTADSLKITINGSFGKFGSKYSFLYSPDLLIQTTITGQLVLLMLIEKITLAGAVAVSANTDGVVIFCDKEIEPKIKHIIVEFGYITAFELERTDYKSIHLINVNNYLAIKTNGQVKGKGVFALDSLAKNPTNQISTKAAIAYIKDGTSIHDTVTQCQDIRDFVTVRTVKGGAQKDGINIGKSIRYYYSTRTNSAIHYASNNNKVPKSDGAAPCLDLPDQLPHDINYQVYINEARKLVEESGYA